MKLLLENLPASLAPQRETLRRVLEAMDAALPIQQVILFGSHARGDARPDSDIDLCLVSEGATRQLEAARQWRHAMWEIRPIMDFTFIPITPQRLSEKEANGDHFFKLFCRRGFQLPRKTESSSPADWLFVADADLAMVRNSLDDDIAYSGCRAKLAEALEKLLKGELLRLGWRLVKTHALHRLTGELAMRDPELEHKIRPLAETLADAYFSDRYPGFDLEDPDWPALRVRLDAITALAAPIRSRLASPSA